MIAELTRLFLRAFAAAFYAWVLGVTFRYAWNREHGGAHGQEHSPKNGWQNRLITTDLVTLLFPAGLAVIFAGFMLTNGWRNVLPCFFRFSTDLLLTMSLYYIVMLVLMPALRKRVSAQACAAAWLLPAYLYFVVLLFPKAPMPRLVFYCPAWILDVLAPVWFAGFGLVFAGFVFSHLRFCRHILPTITDESDGMVRAVWAQELARFHIEKPVRLVRCPPASTPFSMNHGKQVLTILPPCPYTEQELHLIFRHELHHIQRNDTNTRLFFAFLCAFFWFHPLVWLTARESAKDMELSCDEIVLEDADDDTRKRYASLLLHTAARPRGFTTCLSADARALRYRLKNVMHERKCTPGTRLLMALLFVCIMCHGTLAFSDSRFTLDTLFADGRAMNHVLYEVYDRGTGSYQSKNEAELKNGSLEPLLAYLSSLSAEELVGSSQQGEGTPEHARRLYLSDENGTLQGIWIYDNGITVCDWYQKDRSKRFRVYYVRGKIDWKKIEAFFE